MATRTQFSKIMLNFYFFFIKNGSGQRRALTLVTDGMEKFLFGEKKNLHLSHTYAERKKKT